MSLRDGYKFLLILIGLALVVILREVLLVFFFSILVAVLFSFPINFFSRWIPRGVALIGTLLLLIFALSGVGYLASQPISNEASQLVEQIPQAVGKVRSWFNKFEGGAPEKLSQSGSIQNKAGNVVESVLTKTGKAAISLTSLLTGFIVVFVLAAFFSYEPHSYHKGILTLIPRDREGDFEEVGERLGTGLRKWLGGIFASMTIMGILTAIGLLIAGIEDWPLLGLITFFATFIPYIGAISSAIPGLLIALSMSTTKFIAALCVYLVVHIVEGYVVEPLIMRKAVYIRPATLLTWQVIMGSLTGILGIAVATPLLVCVKIVVGYFYVEKDLRKKAA